MKYLRTALPAWVALCLLLLTMAASVQAERPATTKVAKTAALQELLALGQVSAPTEQQAPAKGVFLLILFSALSADLRQEEVAAHEALQRNGYLLNPFYVNPTIHAP
jgi:hypothetical protein